MPRINLFTSMEISASGLAAQRARMTTIARNIANAGTTRTAEGGPYRRQEVLLEAAQAVPTPEAPAPTPLATDAAREAALSGTGAGAPAATPVSDAAGGVKVAGIRADDSEFQLVYEPGHPDADASGYVKMPNVNMINEMVDMMMAARAYEANLSALTTSRDLLLKTLAIGRQ